MVVQRLIDAGIVGAISGGVIGGSLWLIRKVWPEPIDDEPIPEPEPAPPSRRPLTRQEMIDGLRAMAVDPEIPDKDREKAIKRLRAFEKLGHGK